MVPSCLPAAASSSRSRSPVQRVSCLAWAIGTTWVPVTHDAMVVPSSDSTCTWWLASNKAGRPWIAVIAAGSVTMTCLT